MCVFNRFSLQKSIDFERDAIMSQLSTLGATCTEQNITEFEQIANSATDLFVDPSDIGAFLQRFTKISGSPKVIAIRNRCLAHFFNRVSNDLKEKIICDIPILRLSREHYVNTSASELLLHVDARIHATAKIICGNGFRIENQFLEDCGITDETAFFEIAKICAQQNSGKTAEYIKWFKIKNQKYLVEIAIICAQQNGYTTACNFRNFGITEERDRIAIAEACAGQSGSGVSRFFHFFDIQNERARIRIAKMSARENGKETAQFIEQFALSHETVMQEILPLCVIECPGSLSHLFQLPPGFSEIFRKDNSGEWKQPEADSSLDSWIKTNLDGCGFDWVMTSISSIDDAHARRKVTVSLTAALFLLRRKLTNSQLLQASQLIQAVYALRAPNLYLPLVLEAIAFCADQIAFCADQKEMSQPFSLPPSHMLLARMQVPPTHECVRTLQSYSHALKDGKKNRLLLWVLLSLTREQSLSLDQKHAVLEALTRSPDFFVALRHLAVILDCGQGSLLVDLTPGLDRLSLKALNSLIPIDHVENGVVRYTETFGSCRNPQALMQYAAKMRLTDQAALLCLGHFAAAVMNGTFPECRYDPASNPHLQKLREASPNILDSWRQGLSLDVKREEALIFDPLSWLHMKLIVDRHLALAPLPDLRTALSRRSIGEPPQGEDGSSRFQRACFALAKAKTASEQLGQLHMVRESLQQYAPRSEFMNDVLGKIQLLNDPRAGKGLRTIDTDDPYHLLLCGTDVPESCQRVDGDPQYNKGLLGYLMNGQTRLLAVVDGKGHILSRAIMRLLWDGERPVLFLELRYGAPQYKRMIENLAKAKAREMKLTLTSQSKANGVLYGKGLHSLGGLAPYEYCDGVDCVTRGAFTIPDARIMHME